MRCLGDSGAINTLLPARVAELAGIDCAGVPETRLGAGGTGAVARLVPTVLSVGELCWRPRSGPATPGHTAEAGLG